MAESEIRIEFTIKELFVQIRDDVKLLREHVDLQDRVRSEKIGQLERDLLKLQLNTLNAEKMQEQVQKNSRANFRLGVSLVVALLGNIAYLVTQFWPHK